MSKLKYKKKLREELDEYFSDPKVQNKLFEVAQCLWKPITVEWEPWLQSRFASTTGAAVINAISKLCPDIDTDQLQVDVESGPKEPKDLFIDEECKEVWITESSAGGKWTD